MNSNTLRNLRNLHSWTGVLCGLIVFVVCFSGTIALFYEELYQWEQPDQRHNFSTPQSLNLNQRIEELLEQYPESREQRINVAVPNAQRPALIIERHDANGEDVRHSFTVENSKQLENRPSAAEFLRLWHTRLHLPSPYGGYTVGLVGMIMLLAIISGILTHRKFFKNFSVFRPGRSKRLFWADAHNVFGVWALPFHLMIAFSGALLGLATLFLSIIALVNFSGDTQAARDLILGSTPTAAQQAATMVDIDALLVDAEQRGGEIEFLAITHWGNANAHLNVFSHDHSSFDDQVVHRYWLRDGSWRESWSLGQSSGGMVYAALTPLHFGSYGGMGMKILYAFLGFGSCFLIISGLQLWLTKQARPAFFQRLVHGISLGLTVATLAALYGNKISPSADNIGVLFFGCWAGVMALCFATPSLRHCRLVTLIMAGSLCCGLPIIDRLVSSESFSAWLGNIWVSGVNAAALLGGVALLWTASKALKNDGENVAWVERSDTQTID